MKKQTKKESLHNLVNSLWCFSVSLMEPDTSICSSCNSMSCILDRMATILTDEQDIKDCIEMSKRLYDFNKRFHYYDK